MSGGGDDRKTLVPELLPAPAPEVSAAPRERVAERARRLLERFRVPGAAAGAALLGAQCGYGVVDPAPPPPKLCSTVADPFPQLFVEAIYGPAPDAGPIPIYLTLRSYNYNGFRLDAVRVDGGVLTAMRDDSVGNGPTTFTIIVTPSTVPATLMIDVDLGCGTATTTKHYRLDYTAQASPETTLPVQEIP